MAVAYRGSLPAFLKGAANGVADLDGASKVPLAELPPYTIWPVATKTTTYPITAADGTILCNAASAGFTVTLPSAATVGQMFIIKKIDTTSNVLVIATTPSAKIDNATQLEINAPYTSVTVQSDGTNWWVV